MSAISQTKPSWAAYVNGSRMYYLVVLMTQIRINTVNSGGRNAPSPRNTAGRKAARPRLCEFCGGFRLSFITLHCSVSRPIYKGVLAAG